MEGIPPPFPLSRKKTLLILLEERIQNNCVLIKVILYVHTHAIHKKYFIIRICYDNNMHNKLPLETGTNDFWMALSCLPDFNLCFTGNLLFFNNIWESEGEKKGGIGPEILRETISFSIKLVLNLWTFDSLK